MQINVAVAGYGKLGKALVLQAQQDERFCLKYIFSRRKLALSVYRPFDQAENLSNQVDVLLLALGSFNDFDDNIAYFDQFDTVDCFDCHQQIATHKQMLHQYKPNTLSICASGWDPGLLSVVRGMFDSVGTVATVWGKGQSMGHSNAIRQIKGVLDGVQFTQPKRNAHSLFLQGKTLPRQLVNRVCYVAAVQSDKQQIQHEIKTMPHYFDGYQTDVYFTTKQHVKQLRNDCSHGATVYAKGDCWQAQTTLRTDSNAQLTAQIMLAGAAALTKMKADNYTNGAYTLFDIPLRYFCNQQML